ncbi:hypothetical protein T439DRAFT_324111 [Meredithblackwellia eburnea MCA 4105]
MSFLSWGRALPLPSSSPTLIRPNNIRLGTTTRLLHLTNRPLLNSPRPQLHYEHFKLIQIDGRRTFFSFGIGELLGVMTNPGEMLRSLAESKKLLEEARQEMKDNAERSQIPQSHTFSPLPGFFQRPNEVRALERALGGVPAFTILFGASSVGKTALLRQVLSSDKYHVLHFDLRIAGFADLQSLYLSLAKQMEAYFLTLPELCGEGWGWEEFEMESWAFKHDRLAIEKRIEAGGAVKTSDIAHLMELFQSAMLKYWEFEPMTEAARKAKKEQEDRSKLEGGDTKDDIKRQRAQEGLGPASHRPIPHDPTEAVMREGWGSPAVKVQMELKREKEKQDKEQKEKDLRSARTVGDVSENEKDQKEVEEQQEAEEGEEEKEPTPPPKRVPVFFFDEAHKLPALIQAEDAMKCLLDSMLVLTKQDRLCHVMHATSDPFYMHWIRQMNIGQHCHILSVGDCGKEEARKYFEEDLLPHVPDKIKPMINFEELYKVFGGKLAHLADFTSEFINSDGQISVLDSSHFLQAHALINLQLIHSTPTKSTGEVDSPGFEIYSALKTASPHAAPSPFTSGEGGTNQGPDFTAGDLLKVMARLVPKSSPEKQGPIKGKGSVGTGELPYFPLCREFGARSVDGLIRARILELRWTSTITQEGDLSEIKARKDAKGELGPVVVPTTPVVRFAMGQVLKEYE